MEYRKIQLTGGSTYTVSLPKRWVKKKKLKKGSKIIIYETTEENLLLKNEEGRMKKKVRIEIRKGMNAQFIVRLFITRYIQGYDEISISSQKYIKPDIKKKLKEVSKDLIGLESFGEKSQELTFKVLLQKEINLLESIQQMFTTSLFSLEDVSYCLSERNELIVKDIIQRESEIDKFYFLVLRQSHLTSESFDIGWFHIAKTIERLSDHIENIARMSLLLKNDKSVEKNRRMMLVKLHTSVVNLYSQLIDIILIYKDNLKANELILEINRQQKSEQENLRKLMMKGDVDPYFILTHESFRRILSYISDIAEVNINLSR